MNHIIEFTAGHDCATFECINDSPNCAPGKGGFHGASGLLISFLTKGDEGAVQFVLSTGWLPQHIKKDEIGVRQIGRVIPFGAEDSSPMPFELGFYSKTPCYPGQEPLHEKCRWTDNQPCYYDGSGLKANDPFYALLNGGSEALWQFLDACYEHIFHAKPYPQPAEYPKARRHLCSTDL